LIQHQSTLWWL